MKRLFGAILLLVISATFAAAKPVDDGTARTVAIHFFQHVSGKSVSDATLTYTGTSNGRITYYAFTIGKSEGFVLVAAEDASTPILGYEIGRKFTVPNTNRVGVTSWLDKYAREINYIAQHGLAPSNEIARAWNESITGTYTEEKQLQPTQITAVAPLLPCNWDQNPFYNDDCPYDSAGQALTVTGCPATAMAQIMKKWGYPGIGAGNHSYTTTKYGTLAANFGGTTYNWSNMPDSVGAANSDVAQLMLHLGVSVEMQYGTAASGGSGAYVIASTSPSVYCSEYAYKTFFRYDSTTLHGYARSDYNDSAWMAMMKSDLDQGRPMQYDGQGKGGGHTWVCDGYDANGLFHMNWGWSGSDNGYYTLSTLNPGTLGTGGGDGDFNSGQECIFGIQPRQPFTSGKTYSFTMADSVRVVPNNVNFTAPFVVTAKITNANTTPFTGSIAASIFDTKGANVGDVQILTNQTIAAGGTSDLLTFTTTGLNIVPGAYTVGIYTSTNGKDWTIVGPGTAANPVPLGVNGPVGGIKLSSQIGMSSTRWDFKKPITVRVNFQNNTALLFKGQLRADLFDLDGNFVENIGTYTESNGLAIGASYPAPITFAVDSVVAPTGTYILALSSIIGTDTALCGADLFPNPINIEVVLPPLTPDLYEPNNSIDSAYMLTPQFVNDSATVGTPDANLQNGNQNDYYKLYLPGGYTYKVSTFIHDGFTDPGLYSVDAGVTVNDTGAWSNTYDGAMPDYTVAGGDTLTFLVGPWNEGGTGTYNLTMKIVRDPTNSVAQNSSQSSKISLYPNPANSSISINAGEPIVSIDIVNMLGQSVKHVGSEQFTRRTNSARVDDLKPGVYFATVRTLTASSVTKLVIQR